MRKATKGYRASRGNLWRQMKTTLVRGRAFAFRDRRAKKRGMRTLWINRLNAACRMRGMRYSHFIAGLLRARVELDRKMLSEIAIDDPRTFDQLVELARKHAPKPAPKSAAVANA